ncbi:MAG TPA: integrase arm-type DNA-binding domain-containing protein [Candidatus Tumulicola sp.]|nr:integrase arm-type DNA-binding domain-containing protein [Candidatus Tumulicola sp.]
MTKKALTDTAVRNAKYNARGPKKQTLSDSRGLYVELAPTGGKWWRLAYRFGGKRKTISLGTYPTVSVADARNLRDDAKKLLAKGIDPSAQRQTEKREVAGRAANSFEAVAREWYDKQAHRWVPHHASDVLRRMESNLFPELGDKPISAITAPMLLSAVRKIEHRGAHDLAHRVLQVASQIFRYGVASGRCERDPAPDLRGALTPHKKRNQAAVTIDELPKLLRDIAEYHPKVGDKLTGLALQLLAMTFVRTGELIGATWDEIDLKNAVWIIPAARMKMRSEHVVPLSRQADALLRGVQDIGGGSRYVFPGRNPDKPMSNNTMLFALHRLGYKGKMTGHGFRAVASTILNESGRYRSDVIERQLAHCEHNDVRGAYNRAAYLPERRRMMQDWSDTLDALVKGAQVIPLQRRA